MSCDDCSGGGGSKPTFVPQEHASPRGIRQGVPPYKLFFTWDIQYACNYRCTYCIVFESGQWDSVLKKKDREPVSAQRWMDIWDGIFDKYGTAHVHVSGGEPFHYPNFVDIAAHMTRRHTLEADTNLSFNVNEFIGKVRPGSFRFSASFHPEFAELKPYLLKCRKLKEAGHDFPHATFVTWPPHLPMLGDVKKAFSDIGVTLNVITFRGRYKGKDYPDAFTEEERRLINEAAGNQIVTETYQNWYKGKDQGSENHSRQAVLCHAGQMYAKIHPNGDALRCCFIDERGKMGNLIDGTFELYDEPKICEYRNCSCWRSMIVGEEDRWLKFWVPENSPARGGFGK